jgi:phage terminase small subunit
MAKKRDLTPKEQIFVREYLLDGNGTRAAIAAGYSSKTAAVTASKLLRKAKVAETLANLNQKRCETLEISAERVLQGIAQLAFYDNRKFFNEDGSLKRVIELSDDIAPALSGIEVEKLFKHFGKGQAEEIGTITKIKLADRGLNLERLGRHLKLFTERIEVEHSLSERFQKAMEEAEKRVSRRRN